MQWPTHEVTNQAPPLRDYNLYATDTVLQEGVRREQAGWHETRLHQLGAELGSEDVLLLGELANRHPPALATHDSVGHRIDSVTFHPSWHQLLALLRREAMHALPWLQPVRGAHVAPAAGYYLHGQVEAGSLCPTTMTFAAIPLLRNEPVLLPQWEAKLLACEHDLRDLPISDKRAAYIGMGMTEKQGGSDVRSNTTVARPLGKGGRGGDYCLTGTKVFLRTDLGRAFGAGAHRRRSVLLFRAALASGRQPQQPTVAAPEG